MASKAKTMARQRCSSMLCLRGSSGTTLTNGATPAISRKRRSLGDLMKRPIAGSNVAERSRGEGDPSISFPWNFQVVLIPHSTKFMWMRVSTACRQAGLPNLPHEKKSSLSVGTKARPLQDVDHNADARTGIFCFGPRKAFVHNKAVVVEVSSPQGDPGITTPWGFKVGTLRPSLINSMFTSSSEQHNIHVDENFNGLPSGWTRPDEARRINTLLDMAPEADAAISVPWNFKHCFHVSAGLNGIPTGLPPTFFERLGELGFTEGEIAAIRKYSSIFAASVLAWRLHETVAQSPLLCRCGVLRTLFPTDGRFADGQVPSFLSWNRTW
ncbi:uncharacterized protein B0H18DRAFT_1106043 [Fomitopsis serialis]|uniref:uncharacterized protein n=1 Tax=Fomitopsis serialis TaxID=139415 RepID=UPI002007857C|nr:uncharacterized protein B0H18DRAFT_1106043 [Neoantrodia serialis]KAH9921144.1 hypothetical protein B0H18DRAFT_1106043 [Neoantrodia serialis]